MLRSNVTHWRDVLVGSPKECVPPADEPRVQCNGAFVAFLSGDRYLAGALCLHQSLLSVNSRCPFVLVYDDRPEFEPSVRSLRKLVKTFRPENLVPITALFSQWPRVSHTVRQNFSTWRHFNYSAPQQLPVPSPISAGDRHRVPLPAGRRLYQSMELYNTQLKLWLFALPEAQYQRIVVLDIDMVVVCNIDFLLTSFVLSKPVAAVSACSHYFNSGLFVASPRLAQLKGLLAVNRHAAHTTRACESKPGDQTVLNQYFKRRWEPLPITFVTKWKGKTNATWSRDDPAVLHFSSEPKPWDKRADAAMRGMWTQFRCQAQRDFEL